MSQSTVARRSCPVSRKDFAAYAHPINVVFSGDSVQFASIALPKTFSTNSMGYNVNAKCTVMIDGKPVECQVGVNITVIGSKELPLDAA